VGAAASDGCLKKLNKSLCGLSGPLLLLLRSRGCGKGPASSFPKTIAISRRYGTDVYGVFQPEIQRDKQVRRDCRNPSMCL